MAVILFSPNGEMHLCDILCVWHTRLLLADASSYTLNEKYPEHPHPLLTTQHKNADVSVFHLRPVVRNHGGAVFKTGKSARAAAGEFELMFTTNTEVHKIVRISKTNQDISNL